MSKKIILKQIKLKNFKGIKYFTIDTQGKNISIYGDNGVGKTTIFDAFTWLLFGKDSHNISKFDVQPLDAEGNVIHMLDTEVEGILNVDGKDVTLKKVLKEKWVTKRGETDSELKGTETTNYINELPSKQNDYKDYISSIIDENIFKLITNPLYFSTVLSWQERRKVLMDIIGSIDDGQVINYSSDLKPLEALLQDDDIETLKAKVKASIKKLKKDKEDIPARVDELTRTIKSDLDFDALDINRRGITAGIKSLDEEIADGSKVGENVLKEKNRLYELKGKLKDMEYEASSKAQEPLNNLKAELYRAQSDLNNQENKLSYAENNIQAVKDEINRLNKANDELRDRWHQQDESTIEFNDADFVCPTCKRPFDEADVETKKQEMQENFNRDKAETLREINEDGVKNKKRIDELNKQLENSQVEAYKTNINSLEKKCNDLQQQVDNFVVEINYLDIPGYKKMLDEVHALETKIQQPAAENPALEHLRNRKAELETELKETDSKLAYKKTNEDAKARIEELKANEKKLAQQIADLEKQEYLTEQFTKTKVELLESSIDKKFHYVTFKLFETQVNGGLVECCEPLVNGVPFSSNLNNGAKINAGLDIINALCDYYQAFAPIFIDNRESLSNAIEVKSQVINLIKPASFKELDTEIRESLITKYGSYEAAEKYWNERNKTLRVERG